MSVSKEKALKLIDEKINQFQRLLDNGDWFSARCDTKYYEAYDSTKKLLAKLFPYEEAKKFGNEIPEPIVYASVLEYTDYNQKVEDQNSIKKCIIQLHAYRDNIQNFWDETEIRVPLQK